LELPEALVTRVQQDFKVCLAPQEVLGGREQLVSRVHPDFPELTVTQAVKVYKAPKDLLVFLVDLEHKALLEPQVCGSYIYISYDVFSRYDANICEKLSNLHRKFIKLYTVMYL
jgi:hypothetical protein